MDYRQKQRNLVFWFCRNDTAVQRAKAMIDREIFLNSLTKAQLISMVNSLCTDPFTHIMNASAAYTFHSAIPANKALLMIDFCSIHSMNHKYTMNGTNERWINIFKNNRLEDILIKYGGDEFVVIIDQDSVAGYIEKLSAKMIENDSYAIVAIVTTSNSLKESVNRADAIVTAAKYSQEINGMKPDRDAEYCMGDSHFIYE